MSIDPDTTDIVKRIPILSDLDDARLAVIAETASLHSVMEGTSFYEEDDGSLDAYVIVSGVVGLQSRRIDSLDEQSELFILRSGMLFGIMPFLDGARRDLSAVAKERTLVIMLNGPRLKEACDADPVIGKAVYSLFGMVASRRARDLSMELRNALAERGITRYV